MEHDKNTVPKTIVVSDDMVEEIFQHLPIKSLTKFKILSKECRGMIESTHFSHKRLVHKGLPSPNMKSLVVSQQLSAKFHKEDSNSTTLRLDTFSGEDYDNKKYFDKSQNKTIQVLGSCDGLVLIRIYDDFRYIYLINPTTKEHITLFPEFSQWPVNFNFTENRTRGQVSQSIFSYEGELLKIMPFLAGFGKDIVTKSYKVVLIYSRPRNCVFFKTKVISLDNGEQRDADFSTLEVREFCEEQTSVYANGSLFWLTLDKRRQTLDMVLAIDLHTEKFRWIMLPVCYTNDATRVEMWNLNDQLCLANVQNSSHVDVWSLQEQNPTEDIWERIYSIDIKRTSQLPTKFWMLGLAALYFPSIDKSRGRDPFVRQRMISYSPTMISPSSLML
ncbi:putative F-box protein At1g71320 [Capsella rubella]|uniref:putative F-box protein At1g71320 n=1 Tax=Capsella rubella TaxID=81985 RepID=UPI000CD4A252|nr:putative F-box protein At1g71320 [Capsella rubella]